MFVGVPKFNVRCVVFGVLGGCGDGRRGLEPGVVRAGGGGGVFSDFDSRGETRLGGDPRVGVVRGGDGVGGCGGVVNVDRDVVVIGDA